MEGNSNLKTKTLSGMIWSFIQRFGTMLISFVSNIVLARLLTPDDYGTIGMLMIFIAVANTFVDGGFGAALIQKKEPTQDDYSTIFWWNMFLSLVLYGVLYVCAPAVARFYDLPLLSQVLRVQGLVLILNALSIIQQNQLRKQLKFKRLASVTVVSAVLSAGIAIVLAYKGWGVWALVAQQLMLSGFTAIILWVTNKWYPSLIFSKKSFKELFSFGGYILSSNLINTLCNNVQGLLIGKFFPPATLGYYTQARKLEEVSATSISTVVNQVTYPLFAGLQDNKVVLKKSLRKVVVSIAYVTIPLMLMLMLVAQPLIVFLYSEKWLPSVSYFQILCIGGIAPCLYNIYYSVVASVGKSRELFVWTVIKRLLGILVIVAGMLIWNIDGLIWGVAISSWIILFVNAGLVSKHIRYSIKEQLRDILPVFIIAIFVFFITFVVKSIFTFGMYMDGLLTLAVFALSYLVISHILQLKSYKDIRELLLKYIKH